MFWSYHDCKGVIYRSNDANANNFILYNNIINCYNLKLLNLKVIEFLFLLLSPFQKEENDERNREVEQRNDAEELPNRGS